MPVYIFVVRLNKLDLSVLLFISWLTLLDAFELKTHHLINLIGKYFS